jgi:hypothetical protein
MLDEEDISNGICEQRRIWFKIRPFYKSLTVDPDWLVQKKKYREMGIGVRLNPAQQHQFCSSFGLQNVQKCPVCRTMMVRDVESSFDSVCWICRTHFCFHCAVQYSGKFGWRTGASTHEPTCREYRHSAPGAEPLYVQRRLEEEKFAEQSKLQLCLALAESLQWPSLLQEPPKRLADTVLFSSDNGTSHALSIVLRNSLDGILSSWGACSFCYVSLCVLFQQCYIFMFVGWRGFKSLDLCCVGCSLFIAL